MIIEHIAHLTAPSGNRYQVLNSDGTDWDEAATVAAYHAGEPVTPEPAPASADAPPEASAGA